MAPLILTFGVEFEFSLATLADDVKDPHPADDRPVRQLRRPYLRHQVDYEREGEGQDRKIKRAIARKLREAGLPTVIPLDSNEEEGFEVLSTTYPWMGGHWVATTDSSICPPKDDYDWWPIEINSPPLMFCKEALEAVLLACKTLTSNFRINVNATTGLHVHVGNGNENFTFDTTKKLMAFLWTFAPVIDTLHPQNRFHGNYCRAIRETSSYGDMCKSNGLSKLDVLVKILKEKHKNNMLRLMSDTHSATHKEAYHTGNLEPGSRSGELHDTKVTLEFRQHEGTLEGDRTVAWIQTVVGLLEFAEDCDRFWMAAFLMEHAALEN